MAVILGCLARACVIKEPQGCRGAVSVGLRLGPGPSAAPSCVTLSKFLAFLRLGALPGTVLVCAADTRGTPSISLLESSGGRFPVPRA